MTEDQFNELYDTLSALPVLRTYMGSSGCYIAVEHLGQTYVFLYSKGYKYIYVGYFQKSKEFKSQLHMEFKDEFFILHNLQGRAFYSSTDKISLDFAIHGEGLSLEEFHNHPLVVLEKNKSRLKKKIQQL